MAARLPSMYIKCRSPALGETPREPTKTTRAGISCAKVRAPPASRAKRPTRSASLITTKRKGCRLQELGASAASATRSEEHTSELQSRPHLVCRLLLEKKKNKQENTRMLRTLSST